MLNVGAVLASLVRTNTSRGDSLGPARDEIGWFSKGEHDDALR
jgi:hypothetical protein